MKLTFIKQGYFTSARQIKERVLFSVNIDRIILKFAYCDYKISFEFYMETIILIR